jgi:stearoyl-CoA desaturase (delta-9 desaturase)
LSAAHGSEGRPFSAMEHVSNALFVAIHASVMLVFVVPFSWKVVALAFGGYGLRMWAITAGYHRYFAHRSYKTSRAWQLVLALVGTTAMQNGPIWWASVHRRHHKYADGPTDPHSPVQRGFWYSHIGWIFDRTIPAPRDESTVQDLMVYPELRWVDRHEWVPLVAYAFACFAIGGVPGLVWGFAVSSVAVLHATMLINSLAHLWGSRRYETRDQSRNNAFLAVLTFGEGWHNNHHFYMSSARQGFFWWELDFTYYTLKVLSWLGVIWDVRVPPRSVLGHSAPGLARHPTLRRGSRASALPR